jgi:hypothetical protein
MILKKELEISGKKKPEILQLLKDNNFTPMEEIKAIIDDSSMDIDGEGESLSKSSYDYLLNMQFWSLSHERIDELEKEKN